MTSTQQLSALAASNCEVAFDNLTRQLYATDASPYQIEPAAVAFPRGARQAIALIQAASDAGIHMTPRGAGTGLAGGALGDGLVIDFARYNKQIVELDLEKRTVRVGAGVVLEQLNRFLHEEGYCFGPDVATSSRATLGGMIANNSSGAHALVHGTTADHVEELEIVLAGGKLETTGIAGDTLPHQHDLIENIAHLHELRILERFPPGLRKRWHGYGLERCLQQRGNLNNVLCGSEGTLAAILSARLKIVPLPKQKGLGLVFFDSLGEAMQAGVELLDLQPAAIEHLDRILLDQTRGRREFQAARDLLELDTQPCESVLVVEFFEDVPDRLAALAERGLGSGTLLLQTESEAKLVWDLRRAGLSLLTGRKGEAKPVTGIEDTAVRPAQLPEYVASLQVLLARLGLEASFYGHVATGLLHVRPVLNLHAPEDVQKFRQLAGEVSALVRQFKGSLAGEHGVGIARTEFLPEHVGEELMNVMREIKNAFDPHNLFNPGKIIPDGRYQMDAHLHLRARPGSDLKLPFEPVLAFAAKDESFIRNLEQCNGCGACLKETPAMCPTFIATGQEIMSTRGRANTIRAVLEGRGLTEDPLRSAELSAALSNCIACRACVAECPSNVDLPLLKAELQHARIQRDGLTLRQRLFSSLDTLDRWGCSAPWLGNLLLNSRLARYVGGHILGFAPERQLPGFARERFDRWFATRDTSATGHRGRVVLWDDTFVRYHEPHVGQAAVQVLEAAGFEVALVRGRKCCGRPAFNQGHLDAARELGAHNLALLNQEVDHAPILFLEPSCYSMFAADYRELSLPDWESVARRCILFEEFIEALLNEEPAALRFNAKSAKVIIHAHCHARALKNPAFMEMLARRLPNRNVTLLDTGCCGMAGSFGTLASKYELSVKMAEPLIAQVRSQPFGAVIVASGISCRHQIQHLAPVRPRHMAEVLAEALA